MCSTNLGGERRRGCRGASITIAGAPRAVIDGLRPGSISARKPDSLLGRRALMYDALVLPGMSLANGVSLSSVLAHSPTSTQRGLGSLDPTVYTELTSTAEELLRLEAEHPGAGAASTRRTSTARGVAGGAGGRKRRRARWRPTLRSAAAI